jgi:hypothetical protein
LRRTQNAVDTGSANAGHLAISHHGCRPSESVISSPSITVVMLSRFNRDFGIYYCAADEAVAIAESSHHRVRFLRESRIDKTTQEMRVIRAQLGPVTLHDIRYLAGHAIYHPDDYGEAQQFGYALRKAKSFGVHCQSVRAKGECYGVMRARALSDAIHWRYLRYHYDQGAITDVESIDGSGKR